MNAIFLSDVHLRDADSVKSRLVIRFLQEVASQFEQVYILGDLFDVWPGTNPYLVDVFRPVIDSLKYLVEKGHEVHYIEGNHDFKLGEFFTKEVGIHVHPDGLERNWNGRRVYMAHGDLGNPREVGYRVLRYLLRHQLTHRLIKALPDNFIYQAGMKSSQLSRKVQKNRHAPKTEAHIRQVYRQAAETIFARGYDVVLMGHTHLPDDVTTIVEGRTCRYINTGDWVSNFTYLEFDGTQFYTRTHPLTNA